MYFNQQTSHQCSAHRLMVKIIFLALKQVFPYFYFTNGKKESAKNNKKNMHKKGVYQYLGASLNGTKIKSVPKYILLNKHLLSVHLPVVTFLWKIEVSRFSFILSKMSYPSKEDISVLLSPVHWWKYTTVTSLATMCKFVKAIGKNVALVFG